VARVRKFVEDEMGGLYDTWGWRRKIFKKFSLGKLKERERLDDLDTDGRILLKWIIKKYDDMVLAGFICVMTG
jgi:hypothetical protein